MILGLLSFHSAGWGRSCRQVDNPRAGAEGSLKPCAPPSSLPAPAPAPLWAVLVGDVAIPAMAASGLGRGLQPGLWLPTEAKGKEGSALSPDLRAPLMGAASAGMDARPANSPGENEVYL